MKNVIQECYWIDSEEEWREIKHYRKMNKTRIQQIRTASIGGRFMDYSEIAECYATDPDVVTWIATHPQTNMKELKMVFGEDI